MKLTEAIKRMQKTLEEQGDIEVITWCSESDLYEFEPEFNVEIVGGELAIVIGA